MIRYAIFSCKSRKIYKFRAKKKCMQHLLSTRTLLLCFLSHTIRLFFQLSYSIIFSASLSSAGSFSTFTAQTLYSGILAYLSNAAFVRILALPSGKWNGIQVSFGDTFSPTHAVENRVPLLDVTLTFSPFSMPRRTASSVFISMKE